MKGKSYAKGKLGRLITALLLSMMMTVTFVPTFGFAETADQTDDGAQAEQNVDLQNNGGQEEVVEEPAADEGDVASEAADRGTGETPETKGEVNAKDLDDDFDDSKDPEGIELNKIEFGTGINLEWSWAWTVDGWSDTVSPADMVITVVDENKNVVDPSNYTLQFMRTYYDEQEDGQYTEEATLPLGIYPADQVDSVGFTEYVVYAEAVDESGYTGSTSWANFYIADKYSLNYICAEKEFVGYIDYEDWRQATRYWVPLIDLDEGTAVTTLDGVELEEDEDYTVTYYNRTADPEDEDADRDEVLTPSGEPLEGMPTEAGGYLAVFEATEDSDYYGGDVVLLDVGDYSEMYFSCGTESDEWEDIVYDDGTLTYTLETAGIPDDAVIEYTIIRGNGDPLPTGCCAIDETERTVTLNGQALVSNGVKWVLLRAEAKVDGKVICTTYDEEDDEDWLVCSVMESCVDYDYEDCELLPGEDFQVDGGNTIYIENTAHPMGEKIDYTTISVKVTDGAQLIKEEYLEVKDGSTYIKKEVSTVNLDDFWFAFRVKNINEIEGGELGDIKLTVAYELKEGNHEPPEAQTGTFGFTVSVKTDIYGVELYSKDGLNRVLPGQSITLIADGWHRSLEENNPEEKFDYVWSLGEGSNVATLVVDSNDSSTAVLTFNDIPAGFDDDDYSEEVQVCVKMYKGSEELAVEDLYLAAEGEYYQLEPLEIDNPELGQSVSVTPKLMHYEYGKNKPTEVKDAVISLKYYNDQVLSMTKNGGTWTFTRLKDWGTNIEFKADWEGEQSENIEYFWENKEYFINFPAYNYTVSSDCQTDVELDTSELGEWNYEIEFEVGNRNGEQWIDAPEDIYSTKGTTVTIYGDKLADSNLGGVNVHALLLFGDEVLRDTWCWVGYDDDACVHEWGTPTYTWAEDYSTVTAERACQQDESHKQRETVGTTSEVTKAATCEGKGTSIYTSKTFTNNDFEVQTKQVDIPASGHKTEPRTEPAGYLQNGASYNLCTVCGKKLNYSVILGIATSFVKGMKAAKGKGAITVKWKKQKKANLSKFNGYQIEVATDPGFTNIVKSTTAGKKSKSKKIKGLKKKTQYYVHMRSYTVSGGVVYYSPWTTRGVKTK